MNVDFVHPCADRGVIKGKTRNALRKHFDQTTGKKPMILPVILEVC